MNDHSFIPKALVVAFALQLFSAMLPLPAFGANSGLDTPTGVTSLPFSVQGVEIMTLTGTGLGIGTAAPVGVLNVSGTWGQNTAPSQIMVTSNGGATAVEGIAGIGFESGGFTPTNPWMVYAYPTGIENGNFCIGQNGVDEPFCINRSGSVGIGLAAPQAPLDINGGVRASNPSSIRVGSCCSPEGMIGYDLSDHLMVYCSQGGTWTSAAGFTSCTTYSTVSGQCSGNDCGGSSYAASYAPCPSGYTTVSGGCSTCDWLTGDYLSGNTQVCTSRANTGDCIGGGQHNIAVFVTCCH